MSSPSFNSADARVTVLRAMARAASLAGRHPGAVALTAVSKQQPWTAITPVLEAGQTVFGENRVQEAVDRWAGRRSGLELRLIGPLQTNKARQALGLFDVIETLDRESLAKALAKEIQALGVSPKLFVQVNTGEEPQKSGVGPREVDAFIGLCKVTYNLPLAGLMCIPPEGEPPGPHFALLAKLAHRNGLQELSMGMSQDFETAIRFGATSVRIGSALFGPRSSHA